MRAARSSRRGHRARALTLLAVGAVALGTAFALPGPTNGIDAGAATVTDPVRPDAARGLHYAGLELDSHGPCGHHFRLLANGTPVGCSHGPDPAPAGTDVTQYRSTADLLPSGLNASPGHGGSVQCVSDGVSGARVQAVYAVASDQPDRYSALVPSISSWAGAVDGVISQSAAESGGDRHVRFVTNPDCSLNVLHVVVSATGDDTFANTISELQQRTLNKPLTKYLIWMDATVYCGISELIDDDAAAATNSSNSVTEYARVDTGCWGRTDHLSEAHELMHSLGSVQLTAPHATANGHCTDESDAMCYSDAAGVTMTFPCPAAHEWLLDCDADDYFDANPSTGSYLATHWNTANSQFLLNPAAGTTTTVPSTTTATFTGSISAKRPKQRYTLSVGTGSAVDALQFSAGGRTKTTPTLQLTVRRADGTVVGTAAGPSVVKLTTALDAGSYTWEVGGTTSVSFTLRVTYASAQ